MSTEPDYTLLDARLHPQQYKTMFQEYCTELSESDPTISQYDSGTLAEENLCSSFDHPYLVAVGGEPVGLVVFMDEEAPRNEDSCHSYLGEIFIRRPYRRRGIAGLIAGDFFAAQEYDAGLCYVRGSAAEKFWQSTVTRLGYGYEIFSEDELRDFMHIRLHPNEAGKENIMEKNMIDNMIAWAKSRIGDTNYAGWCLSFIEDALEISNDIEIFGGDSAKESCELYRDALHGGQPERGAFVFYDCLCLSESGPINWGHCGIALEDGNVIHAWDRVRTDHYLAIEKMTALTGDHPKYLGWIPISRVLTERNPNEGNDENV